jgi:hypothetical protein
MAHPFEDLSAEKLADRWNTLNHKLEQMLTPKQSELLETIRELEDEMKERDEF